MKRLLFYAVLAAVAMTVIASACSDSTRETSCRYVGTFPAADGPGILYDLKLIRPAGDSATAGDFALTTTYLEAENGRDAVFDWAGQWTTLLGIPGDATAQVYRLVVPEQPDTMYFLDLGNRLELLGEGLQRPRLGSLYTLVLAK